MLCTVTPGRTGRAGHHGLATSFFVPGRSVQIVPGLSSAFNNSSLIISLSHHLLFIFTFIIKMTSERIILFILPMYPHSFALNDSNQIRFMGEGNQKILSKLVTLLEESNQEVPEWLIELRETKESSGFKDTEVDYGQGGYNRRGGSSSLKVISYSIRNARSTDHHVSFATDNLLFIRIKIQAAYRDVRSGQQMSYYSHPRNQIQPHQHQVLAHYP